MRARLLTVGFGVLTAVTAVAPDHPQRLVAVAAVGAVASIAIRWRPCATAAVALAVVAVAFTTPSPAQIALCGLAATALLLVGHGGVDALSPPAVLGALGVTAVVLTAGALAPAVAWAPLLAAPAVLVAYASATRPFTPAATPTPGRSPRDRRG